MTAPINLRCGEDFYIEFSYADAEDHPIVITDPKMEVRSGQDSTSSLLYSSEGSDPKITTTQPATNSVRFAIDGEDTKNEPSVNGFYDVYAMDADGNSVCLSGGVQRFQQTANVTLL